MLDVIAVVLSTVLFAVSLLYVRGCDALKGKRS